MTVDIKALAAIAAEQEDQTKAPERSDFEYKPAAAGITVARFIEYIELGKHKQGDFNGKAKPDAEMVRIGFELLAPKNIRTEDVNGVPTKFADKIYIETKKSSDPKANFRKLFDAMTYGRDIKHMAVMLGEAFVVEVVHNTPEVEAGKTAKTYANLKKKDGPWLVQSPFKTDPLTNEKTAYPVPEPLSPVRIFLWKNPTKESWDSLFIDGTRTVKVNGAEQEVSKNWLQEKIISATDFDGSPLMQLLGGVQGLPTSEGTDALAGLATGAQAPENEAGVPEENPTDAPTEQAALSAGAEKGTGQSATASAASAASASAAEVEDPLKALGLA